MTPKNLEDLYLHELRDLYSAEKQLLDALPEMAEKASNAELRRAFHAHFKETEQQKERLRQIFDRMDKSPTGHTCKAMRGLIKEANSFMSDASSLLGNDAPDEVLDAGLIAQAQRVEHYEIAAYGTAVTYAEMLGRTDDHRLLKQTLDEERSTDEKLNRLAKGVVNPAAASA